MTHRQGEPNDAVRAHLAAVVAGGEQLGFQVAAYLHGRRVIDAWAGYADRARRRPVEGTTLFRFFSTGKGIQATGIHLLVERGVLAYEAPVARYWPAFAARGKGAVTLRQVLAHTAGVPYVPAGWRTDAPHDWDAMCAAVADLALVWAPGSRTGYHAITQGWILGEVIRRVDGRRVGQFVRDELGTPLGDDDLFFGVPAAVAGRLAEVVPSRQLLQEAPPDPTTPGERASPGVADGDFNNPALRSAENPAVYGAGTARAIARHYAALIGEVDGVRLLPPSRVATATTLATDAPDTVLGLPFRKALGYWLGGPGNELMGTRLSAFGKSGHGGAAGFADPEQGFACAVTRTTLAGYRTLWIVEQVRDALGLPR